MAFRSIRKILGGGRGTVRRPGYRPSFEVLFACRFLWIVGAGEQQMEGSFLMARWCCFLLICAAVQVVGAHAIAQPGPVEVIRIRASKPVTSNDVKFVLAAETEWTGRGSPPIRIPGKTAKPLPGVPVEIQLHITNLSKNDLIFPTAATFGLKMQKEDGTRVMPRGGSDPLVVTKPVLIPTGATYSLCRRAELFWDATTNSMKMVYWARMGSHRAFGPLQPGRYKLSFWYHVSQNRAQQETKIGSAVPWVGEVLTEEVEIEVLNR